MSEQATAAQDSAAGVIPAAPWRIKAVSVMSGLRLAVTFNDGRDGVVDFSGVTTSAEPGIYAPLKDSAYFERVTIALGAVTWPNGADIDPMWMYEGLAESRTWFVPI